MNFELETRLEEAMISPELLRRYPFFANLSHEHLLTLAQLTHEESVEAGHTFFQTGDDLHKLYLVVEGIAAIVIEVPDGGVEQSVSGQLTGTFQTKDVVVSAIGPGEVFGWSALVSPHTATAAARATTPCRVIALDCRELRQVFRQDCRFGYLMMEKIAHIIRERLRDTRIESLAHVIEKTPVAD
ncbi:MAG: Crp/Fnr family transcriptional regulator [Caldilineae bacterium]|nr:MAG: Crp/Fnr family transcriptional regulator [Caldilineae bacterium]